VPAPSPAAQGVVRVGEDFTEEYPDGDPTASEVVTTLIRAGQGLYDEIDRTMQATSGFPESVLNCLAVIDGAGEPIMPSQISERTFRSSATITSILDTLEHQGWVRRMSNPDDRRSVLVEITDEGRARADQFLPGVHNLEKVLIADLTPSERAKLMKLLATVLHRIALVNAADPVPFEGRRNRPVRLR
jgi:DNA-binding MarR family transcriptional regulator